jgi:hypothetical protein
MDIKKIGYVVSFLLLIFPCPACLFGQQPDTLKGLNLYSPRGQNTQDTLAEPAVNNEPAKAFVDSAELRNAKARAILVREQFVKDSILHRRHALDSLSFLQKELPVLFNAYFRTMQEGIILRADRIDILGDSVLGDYIYTVLPFNTMDPYKPWQSRYILADKFIKISIDKQLHQIVAINAPFLKASFHFKENVLVITEKSRVLTHYSEKFYVEPVDSVFYDKSNRVVGIKKYARMFAVVNNNQKGQSLFTGFLQEMKYVYDTDGQIRQYQIVKYCERWKTYDQRKICSTITYSLTRNGNNYTLARKNIPVNNYADGTYSYTFDENNNLKSISFQNIANTENWQRDIELNNEGNVSCYFDKVKGVIRQSLCMIYHITDPGAKNTVETITTTFEDNGISYFQNNNTTGKSRTRNRMTLEWGPWQ